jgi:hypothetical protein
MRQNSRNDREDKKMYCMTGTNFRKFLGGVSERRTMNTFVLEGLIAFRSGH